MPKDRLKTKDIVAWAEAELDESTEPRRTHLANILASAERLFVAEAQASRKEVRIAGPKKTASKKD